METTKLSSKGQVIIPKSFRDANHWEPGIELVVTEIDGGIFLKPAQAFAPTTLKQAAGCLKGIKKPYDEEEINKALSEHFQENWNGSN